MRFIRRARLATCETDSDGVSSMKKGAVDRASLASISLSNSSLESWPWRMLLESIRARSLKILVPSCSADISSEEATGAAVSPVLVVVAT